MEKIERPTRNNNVVFRSTQPGVATSGVDSLLACKLPVMAFTAKDAAAEHLFADTIRSQEENTRFKSVANPRELFMDAHGMVGGRFRYTKHALRKMTNMIAPGLYKVAIGIAHGFTKEEEHTDLKMATTMVNNLIQLRFPKLENIRLVIDIGQRTIEGIVSDKYEYYSNYTFFKRCKTFMGTLPHKLVFHEGYLHGRYAIFRYLQEQPAFSLQTDMGQELFYVGAHYSNADAGDFALHAAPFICRKEDGVGFVGDLKYQGKLIHLSHKFLPGLERMFNNLGKMYSELPEQAETKLIEAVSARLGAADTPPSEEQIRKLLSRVRKTGVPKEFASRVVELTLRRRNKKTVAVAQLSSRSVYDLLDAMVILATKELPRTREAIEHVAYQSLMGKFQLV